jgi:hypothetical protein
MDDANEEKLLSRRRDDFCRRPMVQNPDLSITISKRGFILMISRAAVWA